MEVWTDLPGMQIYTSNFLDQEPGKKQAVYPRRAAVCFETQYFPDAVHHDNFESPVCRAGGDLLHHDCISFYSKVIYFVTVQTGLNLLLYFTPGAAAAEVFSATAVQLFGRIKRKAGSISIYGEISIHSGEAECGPGIRKGIKIEYKTKRRLSGIGRGDCDMVRRAPGHR